MKNVTLEIENVNMVAIPLPDEPFEVKTLFDVRSDELSKYDKSDAFIYIVCGDSENASEQLFNILIEGKLIFEEEFKLSKSTTVSAVRWEIWNLIREDQSLDLPEWIKNKELKDFNYVRSKVENMDEWAFRCNYIASRKKK
ncbi:MAG: hypothetical protein ACJATI_001017 [Halioglobus sp.]|jgi:hypothetical protein